MLANQDGIGHPGFLYRTNPAVAVQFGRTKGIQIHFFPVPVPMPLIKCADAEVKKRTHFPIQEGKLLLCR